MECGEWCGSLSCRPQRPGRILHDDERQRLASTSRVFTVTGSSEATCRTCRAQPMNRARQYSWMRLAQCRWCLAQLMSAPNNARRNHVVGSIQFADKVSVSQDEPQLFWSLGSVCDAGHEADVACVREPSKVTEWTTCSRQFCGVHPSTLIQPAANASFWEHAHTPLHCKQEK